MLTCQTVNATTLAKYLMLTRPRIDQLAAQGVLEKISDGTSRGRFNLLASVNAYIIFLRDHRPIDPTETDYQRDRARRMSSLADLEALRLDRVKRRLHRSEDVEFVLTGMITSCRQRLLAMPSRMCHTLIGKTDPAAIAEMIRVEVYTALNELAEYDSASSKPRMKPIWPHSGSWRLRQGRAKTVKRAADLPDPAFRVTLR